MRHGAVVKPLRVICPTLETHAACLSMRPEGKLAHHHRDHFRGIGPPERTGNRFLANRPPDAKRSTPGPWLRLDVFGLHQKPLRRHTLARTAALLWPLIPKSNRPTNHATYFKLNDLVICLLPSSQKF